MKTASKISTAARRIALCHNRRLRGGFAGNGKLAFAADGSGGAWYSDGANLKDLCDVVVNMRQDSLTYAEAQEILDNV